MSTSAASTPAPATTGEGFMGGPTVPMMAKINHILGLASDIPADAVAMFTTQNITYQPSTDTTQTREYVGFTAPDQFSWIPAAAAPAKP